MMYHVCRQADEMFCFEKFSFLLRQNASSRTASALHNTSALCKVDKFIYMLLHNIIRKKRWKNLIKCPKCGKEIGCLYVVRLGDTTGDVNFDCSKCYETLFTSEEEARKFLKRVSKDDNYYTFEDVE